MAVAGDAGEEGGMSKYRATAADLENIENSAATLDGLALDLRMTNTVGPEHSDWKEETEAAAEHAPLKELVANLYALADRLRAR
jgi:hypothetical protein